jgi:hypothetical protein
LQEIGGTPVSKGSISPLTVPWLLSAPHIDVDKKWYAPPMSKHLHLPLRTLTVETPQIPTPRLLDADQCRDGVEACERHLQLLKGQAVGLRKVHLRDSYVRVQAAGDETKCRDILRIIGLEEQKSMWHDWINRALDKPSLGAIEPFTGRLAALACLASPLSRQ